MRGGGGEKKKIAWSTNVVESLWDKKGENVQPKRLLEKNILDDQKSPAPPPPQELNGWPPSEELKSKRKLSSLILLMIDS